MSSETRPVSTAIVGLGTAAGLRAVRRTVVRDMATAWSLTFPICAAIAWSAAKLSLMAGSILAGLPAEAAGR